MSVSLSSCIKQIRKSALNCPGFVAEDALLDAAKAFCNQTWAWQYSDELSIVSGEDEYTLSDEIYLPQMSEIIGIVEAKDDNDAEYTAFTADLNADTWIEDDEPTSSFDLTVTVALRPSNDATYLQDFLYDKHLDALNAGALANLLMQPGKDWTNPQLAQVFDRRFQHAVAVERRKKTKGYTNKSLQVQFRTFM